MLIRCGVVKLRGQCCSIAGQSVCRVAAGAGTGDGHVHGACTVRNIRILIDQLEVYGDGILHGSILRGSRYGCAGRAGVRSGLIVRMQHGIL